VDFGSPTEAVVARQAQGDPEILGRLISRGATALSEPELVAILVSQGQAGHSALDCAQGLLDTCGGLLGLFSCDFSVARAQALDDLQAAAVLAAVELCRRMAAAAAPVLQLEDPALVAHYLYLHHARVNQEVFGALFLDVHNRLAGQIAFFRGVHKRVFVEPQPILREAIRRNANGVLLFHNHPSGDPTPSRADHDFTERMRSACDLVGIELLDHLVLGGSAWVSLRRLKPW